jgi:FG-GAP-like repeat
MLTRSLLVLAIAAIACSVPVDAHHAQSAPALKSAPGPTASMATIAGYVDQVVVENRIAGTTVNFPIFVANDGRRFALQAQATMGLVPGNRVVITGMTDGSTIFPGSISAAPPNSVPDKPAANASLEGTLRLGHADNFDGTPSEFFYAIVTDTQQVRVNLATVLPGLANGMHAIVTGRIGPDAEILPDRIVLLAPAATAVKATDAPVTTSYIVIPVKFPSNAVVPYTYGADPFTVTSLNSAIFGVSPTNSVAEFYKEASFGQQLLSGIVANDGIVGPNLSTGWLLANVAAPSTCDIGAIATAAENAATARGYNLTAYTGRVYVFSNNVPGCGWAGLAYVGWARSYIKQTTSLLVIGHELGHNFGAYHAASLDCGVNVIGGTCTSSEYGDPFGIMGNNRAMHFNSAQKADFGWISPTTVKTHVKGRATYTLAPLESSGGSTYAVKIPAATNRTYWLEYRQPTGFDSGLSAFPNNGAQFRVAAPFESICSGCSDDTEFLDMTPATTASTDGALVVGKNYTDALYGISVNVTAATPTALTLEVQALGDPPKPDFDFSGSTDLLWRHVPTGQSALWLMAGIGSTGSSLLSGDGTWTIAGSGDFSGDGKTDLLWRSAAGTTAMWLMSGSGPTSTGILSGDASWTVSHVADFNADGRSDLVWRSAAGATALWQMNGLAPSATAILSGSAAWTISKIGDFNGDGKADLLWRNTAGASSIWLMNGTVVTSTFVVGADPAWQVVQVGDFNADGKDDLIWRHTSGVTVVWLMNGTATIATGVVTTNPALQIERVGDFDGDGRTDLLLRNTSTGTTSIYLMNGAAVASSATLPVPSTMQVLGLGDYNGDGRADLIWRDTASGVTSVWLMNGTVSTGTQTLSSDPGWSAQFPGQ